MSYVRFAARRLGTLVLVLLVVAVATFLMVRVMPGDPGRQVLGPHASQAAVSALDHRLGLDQPIVSQFLTYAAHAVTLNFGTSFITGLSVSSELRAHVGNELALVGTALMLTLLLGIVAGLVAGGVTRAGKHPNVDRAFILFCGIGSSIPSYVAATLLALVFAVTLNWLPIAGTSPPTAVVLPALAIAVPSAALLARIVRAETLNVLEHNYVRTARSKRLPRANTYGHYVLPNALTAALALGGVIFTQTIGAAVLVETVFAWNGLGYLLTQAVLRGDYPVVQGSAMLLAAIVVIVNTLVDIAISLLDPRSAAERGLELA